MADDELSKYKAKQASAWLNGVLAKRRRAEALYSRAKALRDGLDGLRGAGVGERVSGGGFRDDGMAERVAELQEAVNDYCAALMEAMDAQDEAHEALFAVSDGAVPLMVYHYIMGMKWADAAKTAGMEYSSAMHANRRALAKVYEFMPHRFRDPLPPAV